MTTTLGDELEVVGTWIASLFTDPATEAAFPGGVWDGPAVDATEYPFLRFENVSSIVVRGNSQFEIMHNTVWLVQGVTAGSSFNPLRDGALLIQSRLHGIGAITIPGGTIESSTREMAYRHSSVEGGREYRHLGGHYRIYVQGNE